MIEHLQRQAMVYTNIIEQIKSGRSATDVRQQFEELELVPSRILPNPSAKRMLDFCFKKISRYRQVMVDFVETRGNDFITRLSDEVGLAAGLGLELGFPPAISLNFEASRD
jgi:hypothetical protein